MKRRKTWVDTDSDEFVLVRAPTEQVRSLLSNAVAEYEDIGRSRTETLQHPDSGVCIQTLDDRRLCQQLNAVGRWANELRDELRFRGEDGE